ncbi:MAG: universal stress protein [Acidobacteria bacterium]|nr:universal stress protein [Acidobacteriota bacterium]
MTELTTIARVLVGIDLDEASGSVLKVAGALAAAWNAEVTVFHATTEEAPAYFTPGQIEALEAARKASRQRTADQVRRFAEAHVPREVNVVIAEGPPQDAILRMAPAFDLIVIGTRRRQGLRRWWLGSVAEVVVRQAPCPVFVVPDGAVAPDVGGVRTILSAGVDEHPSRVWVERLRTTFGAQVVRFADIHHCDAGRIRNADVIVLSMSGDSDADGQLNDIVSVLKECAHPVLFVPSDARGGGRHGDEDEPALPSSDASGG